MHIQLSVRAKDLLDIMDNDKRGVISLVGENGNLSEITGAPAISAKIPGNLVMETEHGLLYLPADKRVAISEWLPETLGADVVRDNPHWLVTWTIDDSDSPTPREAARSVWATVFDRTRASTGDACVFTVTDMVTGESVTVDLAGDPAVEVDTEG